MRALSYLEACQLEVADILENLNELLPPTGHVSKTELFPIVKKSFFRCHQIRALLSVNFVPEIEKRKI